MLRRILCYGHRLCRRIGIRLLQHDRHRMLRRIVCYDHPQRNSNH